MEVETLKVEDDGIFWISSTDLFAEFEDMTICQLRNPMIHPIPWNEYRRSFSFSEGEEYYKHCA
jgi:hypothetical protein